MDEWRVYARALSQAEIETVMGLPGASFVDAPRQGFAPLAVAFTNATSGAATYVWDFGDRVTTTGEQSERVVRL